MSYIALFTDPLPHTPVPPVRIFDLVVYVCASVTLFQVSHTLSFSHLLIRLKSRPLGYKVLFLKSEMDIFLTSLYEERNIYESHNTSYVSYGTSLNPLSPVSFKSLQLDKPFGNDSCVVLSIFREFTSHTDTFSHLLHLPLTTNCVNSSRFNNLDSTTYSVDISKTSTTVMTIIMSINYK